MKKDAIEAVKTEMRRLSVRICELEATDFYQMRDYTSPKETGAIRRASMDLTRALADLRRSR